METIFTLKTKKDISIWEEYKPIMSPKNKKLFLCWFLSSKKEYMRPATLAAHVLIIYILYYRYYYFFPKEKKE